jgi:phosphoglycolate phosphatase-like HAD superfamily hydrolase
MTTSLAEENYLKIIYRLCEGTKEDISTINFKQSIMIGDSMSDMEFGRNAGMKTIYISEEISENDKIDFNFKSLNEIVISLQNSI